jgi:adenosylcobinamide-GDP ribazoletransferase
MSLAPLASLPLALPAGLLTTVGDAVRAPSLLVAAVVLGALALGSRGLHLDGLADTADGLASGYDRERALTVMRSGDIGPAGTATLLLVLLAQAGALSALSTGHAVRAGVAAAAAVVVSRAALVIACATGVPAARGDGLGATVAGSVPRRRAAVVVAATVAVAALALWWAGGTWWHVPVASALGLAASAVLLVRCVRRLGGVTGDVLGACVEVALTGTLATLAVLAQHA